jgi:integrase
MAWVEKRREGWIARWYIDGVTTSGTRKTQSKYFKFEHDAKQFARHHGTPRQYGMGAYEVIERLQASIGGSRKKLTPVVSGYARELVESDNSLARGTRDGYLAVIRNHVEGTKLGSMRMGDATPQDCRTFWGSITPKKTYQRGGDGAKGNVFRLMAKAFNSAVADGIRPDSPWAMARIKRPSKNRAVPIEPMSIDQIEELAEAASSERNRLAILVGGLCGLRGGEVGGLRVRDIDAAKCRLSIIQAVVRDRGGKHIGLPKGGKQRTITIPCSLSTELVNFVKGRPKSDRVFETPDDGFVSHTEFNKWVKRAAKNVGDESIHAHLLRHACASILIDASANPREVQEYLGHSNVQTTLNLYAHLFDRAGTNLAEKMEALRGDYRQRVAALAIA